jgi:hypothetical protein
VAAGCVATSRGESDPVLVFDTGASGVRVVDLTATAPLDRPWLVVPADSVSISASRRGGGTLVATQPVLNAFVVSRAIVDKDLAGKLSLVPVGADPVSDIPVASVGASFERDGRLGLAVLQVSPAGGALTLVQDSAPGWPRLRATVGLGGSDAPCGPATMGAFDMNGDGTDDLLIADTGPPGCARQQRVRVYLMGQ